MVIRFSLKTLLVFAVVVGILAIGWIVIPNLYWTLRPNYIWVEKGNLVLSYGPDMGPSEYHPIVFSGDSVMYIGDYYLPLWLIGLSAIALAVTLLLGFRVAGKALSPKRK